MNNALFLIFSLFLHSTAALAAPFQAYPGPAQPDSATALFVSKGVEAGRTYSLQVDKTDLKGSTLTSATLRLVGQ